VLVVTYLKQPCLQCLLVTKARYLLASEGCRYRAPASAVLVPLSRALSLSACRAHPIETKQDDADRWRLRWREMPLQAPPRICSPSRASSAEFYGFGRASHSCDRPLLHTITKNALPLQLTAFALCATQRSSLEPRVSFSGTVARAEPPPACRIKSWHCTSPSLVCIGVPRALCLKRPGVDRPGFFWGGERIQVMGRPAGSSPCRDSSRVAPPALSSCDNRHCASPPSPSV
jgi:hypothetical protein